MTTARKHPAHIDLNSDLGEGFGPWQLGNDEAMMDVVTSANLACGFHAGDPATLYRTCRAAARRGIRIGAQVGYRDLAGFGRRFINMAPEELYADVAYQIGALDALARTVGSSVVYVKPHGALYNTIIDHEAQADAVARAVRDINPELPVLTLPHGVFGARARDLGLRVVTEAFADRGYRNDGTLVPRGMPGAVLSDPAEVAERMLAMVRSGSVPAVSGVSVPVRAESICVHGDSPGAIEMAIAVRAAMMANGIELTPFT